MVWISHSHTAPISDPYVRQALIKKVLWCESWRLWSIAHRRLWSIAHRCAASRLLLLISVSFLREGAQHTSKKTISRSVYLRNSVQSQPFFNFTNDVYDWERSAPQPIDPQPPGCLFSHVHMSQSPYYKRYKNTVIHAQEKSLYMLWKISTTERNGARGSRRSNTASLQMTP